MRIEYVPADPSDEEYFRGLNRACYREVVERQFGAWDEDLQSAKFAGKWREQGFRKIVVDGVTVGGVWVEEGDGAHHLRELLVHPDHQNRGIGEAVLRDVIDSARRAGSRLLLKVLRESRARVLYERHGFAITGETEDQHVMELGG